MERHISRPHNPLFVGESLYNWNPGFRKFNPVLWDKIDKKKLGQMRCAGTAGSYYL